MVMSLPNMNTKEGKERYQLVRAASARGDARLPGRWWPGAGVKPSVLVVAPALEEAALKLLNSENGPGGETNPWKGTASLIVAPWLA
ncbi:MAG: Mu-like prophage major head subunit gpT family protein [Rhodobacter sp.]|nr:Mu-like prophage major head subunit gpT family protein [Rhodobacter sp.]